MIRVAIIGTGQIGIDLLNKIIKLDNIKFIAFVGRRKCQKPLPENIIYSDQSIEYFILNPNCCDVVFDCTDAYSAKQNSVVFFKQKIIVIDLTPSTIGDFYIPNISLPSLNNNMVTCGGQASIPFLHYINSKIRDINYIEIVTQINSESAGLATRINIDKYIHTTEKAIIHFINIPKCKVILNINPSINTVMKTTIFIKTTQNIQNMNFDDIHLFIKNIQTYIQNYNVSTPIYLSNNIVMFQITITSSGNILSEYAGNLDVINCAAMHALTSIINAGNNFTPASIIDGQIDK